MTKNRLILFALAFLFAVLMSLPFLVPHCGFFALTGFLPLLIMDRIATLSGEKRVWIYHYSAFVMWNAMTTFWVCNATVGGALFAIFANAFQMSLIFGLFRFSKRCFSGILPYLFLAVMWIAWERAYFDAEISWPWLVLGNAFAGSLKTIQWYEFTGTLGGSLWIWLVNLSLFGILVTLSDGRWSASNRKFKVFAIVAVSVAVIGPFVWSGVIWADYQEKENPMEFLIAQPNIDPYNKFQALSQQQQNVILLSQVEAALKDRKLPPQDTVASVGGKSAEAPEPLLVLAPETFTNDVITNDLNGSRTTRRFIDFLKDYPGVNMLFGASSYTYIDSPEAPSYTARRVRDGRWVESHNSALMTDGSGRTEIFHKNKLVVAVEKTPYPAVFCKIDDWLGGVMGRCVGQGDVSLLHCKTDLQEKDVAVGCAICYESVYGEYYTEYVRKGAEIMTVITNDAWWGNTPGYRQHLRYASLRAIETRRSIARCANTGISAFIDQRGRIVESSGWWKQEVLRGKLNKNDVLTFFVQNGDVIGRLCMFMFWCLAASLSVKVLIRRK